MQAARNPILECQFQVLVALTAESCNDDLERLKLVQL